MTLTQRTNHTQAGLGLLLAQFKSKTNLEGILTTYLTQIQEIEDVFFQILDITLKIESQVGEQLDLIGRWVGQPREGRDDAEYIKWIRARLIINRASGLADELFAVIPLLTVNSYTYEELYPAAFSLTFSDTLDTDPLEIADMLNEIRGGGIGGFLQYTPVDDDDTFTFADGDVVQTEAAKGFKSADIQVAVGESPGAIFSTHMVTSLDATSWTARVNAGGDDYRAVASNQTKYTDATKWLAVGINGKASQSDDGTVWTGVTGLPVANYNGLHYGAGLWVAVGDSGKIATSPDLATWTVQTSPKALNIQDVTYDETLQLWVAVGDTDGDAFIITAPSTADTWTERSNPKNFDLFSVAADGNGQLVACGQADGTDAYLVKSSDGISWTEMANPKNFDLYGVAYGGGLDLATWVCVGAADGTDAYLITSTDLSSWTERSNPKNFDLNSVVWTVFDDGTGEGGWVAAGNKDGTDAYLLRARFPTFWVECSSSNNLDLYAVDAAELGGKWADVVSLYLGA